MKIAQVVCVLPPYGGGLGTVAHAYSQGLHDLGHDVTAFIPNIGENKDVTHDYEIKKLTPLFRIGLGALIPQLLWKLKNFDVIHLHYPMFGAAFFTALVKLFNPKKKFVVTYHQDLAFTGWREWVNKITLKVVTPFVLKNADNIIVSSIDYVENSYIKAYYQKNKGKFTALPFGVPDGFKPEPKKQELLSKYGFTSDDKIILFVGGLDSAHYFKGIDELITALSLIDNPQVKSLIIGKGNLKADYEKKVDELQLHSRVKFAGYVADNELNDHYNLADIGILPSTDKNEAFGLVLIEAMACGKPVIASDLPGVRTVVQNNVNGYVAIPRDSQDIARKIKLILDDVVIYNKFSQNSLNIVQEMYQWPKIIKELDVIIKN